MIKKNTLLLIMALLSLSGSAQQWEQVGLNVIGDNISDQFGSSVSINETGNVLAVGAPGNDQNGSNSGQIKIFEKQEDGTWNQKGFIFGGNINGRFGHSIKLNSLGDHLIIGSPNLDFGKGKVSVYKFNSSTLTWELKGSEIQGDTNNGMKNVGWSVAISSTGDRITVGAPQTSTNGQQSGQVRIYEYSNDNWKQIGDNIDGDIGDSFGDSVDMNDNGNRIVIGGRLNSEIAEFSGIVKIYEEYINENEEKYWRQLGTDLKGMAERDLFGYSVGINGNGDRIIIGAPARSAYAKVFEYFNEDWNLEMMFTSNINNYSGFGRSVSISTNGNRLSIGENIENKAYVYEKDNLNGWKQLGEVFNGDDPNDLMGFATSLSGDGNLVAIGAPDYNFEPTQGYVKIFEYQEGDTNAFITTWQVTEDNLTITIPTIGEGYAYTVDWGDNTNDTKIYTGDADHTYIARDLAYTISISGTFPRIYFYNAVDKENILSIEKWGSNPWTSMEFAFDGCSNLIVKADDVPDLTNVTSMRFLFRGATNFNQDISHWDVSNVTNMRNLFDGATAFNQPLNSWDVSNVTDMQSMFSHASSFNQPLSNWVTTKVLSMNGMFSGASAFNQDISTNQDTVESDKKWDVSNVTNMSAMFFRASSFNQDIGNWNVSSVTNMNSLFNSTAFNQDISSWNVGNVTTMSQMFNAAGLFNQDISDWDVSKVTNMASMFRFVTLSTENYDALLNGWSTQALQNGVDFSGGNSLYCEGATARQSLIDQFGWIITDKGNACPDTEAPMITCLEAKTEYVDNNCATFISLGNPTATDDVSITFIFNGIRSDDAELDAPFDVGITTITWTATDEAGRVSDECEQIITVIDNIPPTGTAPEDIAGLQSISEVPVADIASILEVNDNCEGEITVSVVDSNNGGSGCKDDPYIVTRTFTLTDINGLTTDLIQFITVEDDKAPIVTNIDTPEEPIQIGFDFQLSASFEGNDIKNATWYLSSNGVDYDYSIVGELEGNRINFNNTLAQIPAGVYSIELKVEDTCENYSKLHADVFLVIFDPDGGHVTGGGFIDSPAQALVGSNQQGTANFGFSAKYKKGNNQVDGNTNFQFKAGDFHFKSSYNNDMSLVISGNKKATYKGVGAINGTGEYKFMVSVIDGDAQGGDGDDKFRIKIWEVNSDDEKIVIYDNEVDKSDNADALTPITKGSIVIHNEKVNSNALKVNLPLDLVIQDGEKDDFQVLQWPNPTTDSFTISVETNNLENAKIQVFDFNGKLIINNEFNPYEGYRFGDDLEAGLYIVKIIQAKKETTLKLVKK